jgi:uncharacterized protein with GYD domain
MQRHSLALMATYILLLNLTEQGIRGVKDTIKRAHAFKEMAMGADVKQEFWTLCRYDLVIIVEAPDVPSTGTPVDAAAD